MDFTTNFDGTPGTTVLFTASADSAYSLEDMSVTITDSTGHRAIMVLISIETNSARLAFTADASATLGHLREDGQAFQIAGSAALHLLTLRNAVNGSNFTAQITPFFLKTPSA